MLGSPEPPSLPPVRCTPGVLVVERQQRRWEAALKRQLLPGVFVRPCKTVADVCNQLRLRPGSVVVIDVLGVNDLVPLVVAITATGHAAGILGLAGAIPVEDECTLREIGLTSLLIDPISEEAVAAQCRRMLLCPPT